VGAAKCDRWGNRLDYSGNPDYFVNSTSSGTLHRYDIAAVLNHLYSPGGSFILGGKLRSMIASSYLVLIMRPTSLLSVPTAQTWSSEVNSAWPSLRGR